MLKRQVNQNLHFEISINYSAEEVYRTMLDEKHYAAWTAEFNPTSHFVGSWEKDSKILFLGEDKDGNTGGMASRIKENIPNIFISIEHLGLVQNGKGITSGAGRLGGSFGKLYFYRREWEYAAFDYRRCQSGI